MSLSSLSLSRGDNIANEWQFGRRRYVFTNVCVFNPLTRTCEHRKDGIHDGIAVYRDKIVALTSSSTSASLSSVDADSGGDIVVIDCGGALLSCGFIDWQLNGAYGIDFSNDDNGHSLTVGAQEVARRIVSHGVTSFCPTVVTGPFDGYDRNIPHYKPFSGGDMVSDPESGAGVGANALKLHLEGPVLSHEKAGAHRKQYLREPACFASIYGPECAAAVGNIGVITIAAELPGASEMAAELSSKHNIAVSLGHSNCTIEQAEDFVVKGGCRAVTHLFNAQSFLNNRNPGVVGLLGSYVRTKNKAANGQELNEAITAFGIIADGIHVHSHSLAMAHGCAPDAVSLVTDAISLAGLPEGDNYTVSSQPVAIINSNGVNQAVVKATGVLVGSVSFLDECVRFYAQSNNISIGEAAYAAYGPACRLLTIDHVKGQLLPGYDADLVLLDPSTGAVLATVVGGHCAYCSPLW
jgi:N-acetylglucosamine-6-phosphate deacetylase